ncbi:MAG: hypothetical protein AAGJ92_00690 [Pseudomonadota bacterium]
MSLIGILVAAAIGFVWVLAWMRWRGFARTATDPEDPDPIAPQLLTGVVMVLAAGMVQYLYFLADVVGWWEGMTLGLGLGAFVAGPWILVQASFRRQAFGGLLDAGAVAAGCGMMGAVLGLFP